MTIDGEVCGNVTSQKMEALLNECENRGKREDAA
jgi:hypothetical protein